jgi:hypothetical protein
MGPADPSATDPRTIECAWEPVGGDDMSFGRNRRHDVHVGPRFGSEKEFPPPAPLISWNGS